MPSPYRVTHFLPGLQFEIHAMQQERRIQALRLTVDQIKERAAQLKAEHARHEHAHPVFQGLLNDISGRR